LVDNLFVWPFACAGVKDLVGWLATDSKLLDCHPRMRTAASLPEVASYESYLILWSYREWVPLLLRSVAEATQFTSSIAFETSTSSF
jgi:hypothetical protein